MMMVMATMMMTMVMVVAAVAATVATVAAVAAAVVSAVAAAIVSSIPAVACITEAQESLWVSNWVWTWHRRCNHYRGQYEHAECDNLDTKGKIIIKIKTIHQLLMAIGTHRNFRHFGKNSNKTDWLLIFLQNNCGGADCRLWIRLWRAYFSRYKSKLMSILKFLALYIFFLSSKSVYTPTGEQVEVRTPILIYRWQDHTRWEYPTKTITTAKLWTNRKNYLFVIHLALTLSTYAAHHLHTYYVHHITFISIQQIWYGTFAACLTEWMNH